jgi:hypothetical protein
MGSQLQNDLLSGKAANGTKFTAGVIEQTNTAVFENQTPHPAVWSAKKQPPRLAN